MQRKGSSGSSTCWSSNLLCKRYQLHPANMRNCWELPQTPTFSLKVAVTPRSTLGLRLPSKESSQPMWAATEGQPWYQPLPSWSDWPQSMPVPLQHIMLQLPPCPLPGTLASPGAACDCSICGGFLFHLCSQSKAQLSPPRRALRAGSGGSWACYCFKCPFRIQVATACTWPISPSVACLEQKDISWPEAVGNELCTLLPLSHLSPPVFYIFLGNKNETAWGRANKKHPQRPVPQCFSPALQVPSINRAGPAQPGKSHHTKLRWSPSHQLQQ